MIYRLLKNSSRQLSKNIGYSLLNVAVLSCGFLSGLFLISYSLYQTSFDRFHRDSKNTFLFEMIYLPSQGISTIYLPPPPILYEYLQTHAGVKQSTRVYTNTVPYIKISKTHEIISGGNMMRVDSAFHNIFSFKLDDKVWAEIINQPNTIVISNALAERLGHDSRIGEFIFIDSIQYKIVGVLKDQPVNSSLQFDLLTLTTKYDTLSWQSPESPLIYCTLNNGTSIDEIEQMLEQKLKAENGDSFSLSTVSLADQYFESQLLSIKGDSIKVKIFTGLGILIIFISILNYISSYITIITKRVKEIGIRLILGSSRYQLVLQCIADAIVILLIALFVSIGTLLVFDAQLVQLLGGKEFSFFYEIPWIELLAWLLFIVVLSIAIIALYPFVILKKIQPTAIIRGDNGNTIFSGKFRLGLIALQLMASVILIDYTTIIHKQFLYLESLPLGFNKSDKIFGAFEEAFRSKGKELEPDFNSFKNEVKSLSSVQGVSVNPIPTQYDMVSIEIDSSKSMNFYVHIVDMDFVDVMGIQLLAGKNFNSENSSSSLIINEKAASLLFPNSSAIGESLSEFPSYQIIGVVKDFYFKGFNSGIGPLLVQVGNYNPTNIHVKAMDYKRALIDIMPLWKKHFPDYPIEFKHLENVYDDLYLKNQKSQMTLMFFAATISLILSCLGIFGLSSFHIRSRTKEMSIRTTLGANPLDIFKLYLKSFLGIFMITATLTIPIVYHLSGSYLNNFSIKTDISFFTLIIGFILTSSIIVLTVLIQFLSRIKENPVKHLRA